MRTLRKISSNGIASPAHNADCVRAMEINAANILISEHSITDQRGAATKNSVCEFTVTLQTRIRKLGVIGSMKTTILASLALCQFAGALEVHEWGTFTVLSGPNGMQVPWYASFSDLASLPKFVSPGFSGKNGLARIRMETPVLYFYPEKEMDVSVEVSFANGSITETFPHSHGGKMTVDPGMGMGTVSYGGKWVGKLHNPTDRKALAEIPVIEVSENDEPYGAAREVPDAWIFESGLKEIPGLKVQPHFPQVEKFIFYRGAGDAHIPVSTSVSGDKVTVKNEWENALPFGVALRVRNGKASWVAVPNVAGRPVGDAPAMNQTQVKFPAPDRSIDEVESELAAVWKKALAEQGLTSAEASAMVETWRKTWFRESGDRVLTLIPQAPVDAMLPLEITPAPEKVTRVFVARFEMISDEAAAGLVALLNDSKAVDEEKFARFQKMELGRFGPGAMDIAVDVKRWEMMNNFHALRIYGENTKTSAR